MLKMILAMDENNLVGNSQSKNGLAWYYPEDLKYFKEQTVGKINIMGRKTFAAIGRPLPNRETIVLTNNQNYTVEGVSTIHSIETVLELAETNEVIICGGVSIYQQFNQYVDQIYLTKISATHNGDVYYNDLNLSDFEIKSEKVGENPKIKYQIWERMCK